MPSSGLTIGPMSDSIFLLGDDGTLTEAPSTNYNLEADLKGLLVDNVQLLPGAQINRDNPRRWLLVKREAGVPNHEGAGAGGRSITSSLIKRRCRHSSR